MDARAALRLLLADTGLQVAEADGHTITLNTVIPRDNRVASTGAEAQVAPPQSQPQSQPQPPARSEEHTSELQPLMRISYAVYLLTQKHYINSQYYALIQ